MFGHQWNIYITSIAPGLRDEDGMVVRAVVATDQSETMSFGHSMIIVLINSQLLWSMIIVIILAWRGGDHGSSTLPGRLPTGNGF